MKTALFILIPHLSHYYPTFGLARCLQSRGFRVVYAGMESFRETVEREGFGFVEVCYTDEFVIRSFKTALGLFLRNCFSHAYRRQRYREFTACMHSVEQAKECIRPNLIFLDDTLGHCYPAVAGDVPVVQLSTKLSPRKQKGIPPLNSHRLPKGRITDEWLAEIEWFAHTQKRAWKRRMEKVIFTGWDDDTFQQRYAAKRGLDWKAITEPNMSFYDGIKGLPAVVLAPQAMEFSGHRPQADEHYIHFPIVRDESHLITPGYTHLMGELLERKRTQGVKLVYVSLGTLSHGNYQKAKRFLENTIKALSETPGLVAVVATGGIPLNISGIGLNVCLPPSVPQLDLLPHCDLIITHGGLGTVKECLQVGVPMLVYPLNEEVDQSGNGARVAAHGWGLRGRIGNSPARIAKQINYALVHLLEYREKCRQMQTKMSQAKSEQVVDDFLEELGFTEVGSAERSYIFSHLNT
ncbi:MAG: hypothetical protein MUD08_02550 [Cytophagales bacterium]|jgi:UDP:flavonoid glycosyltransferase YjiC (YdhE family)|nr:hypothetical protein [Cytophagales bacterium]